jgi:DNA invertase Pin-like site-specific DNA recombinase
MDLNLIGVIRVSTLDQARDDRAGIERQRNDVDIVRRAYGATIIRTISVIESGSFVQEQRDFQKLFQDLGTPGVDGIAISSLDRLVRPDNFQEFSILDYFKRNGKRIYTPASMIDPSSQSGWLECLMRCGFSGLEKQVIRERTVSSKERLRRAGVSAAGGRALPRGVLYDKPNPFANKSGGFFYDLDPTIPKRHKTHNPGDALLIRRAFHLFVVEGYSYQAIADILGAGWGGKGIRETLQNPIWIGMRRYHQVRVGDVLVPVKESSDGQIRRYRRNGPRLDAFEVQVIAEPLIDPAIFAKAQEIAKTRSTEFGQRRKDPRFLLSRILQCECGGSWYGHSNGVSRGRAGHDYYVCSSMFYGRNPCGSARLRREAVDGVVSEIVTTKLLSPEVLSVVIAANKQGSPKDSAALTRKRELAALDGQMENLIDLRQTNAITRQQFDVRRKAIEGARRALDTLYPTPVAPWLDTAQLVKILTISFHRFRTLPFNERKQLLRRAVRKIIISGQTITSLTLSGGFLGEFMQTGANLNPHSKAWSEFCTTPDVVIQFPQPIEIQWVDGRRRIA